MARCIRCGRWGLFLRTNYSGVCFDCIESEQIQKAAHERSLELERKRERLYRERMERESKEKDFSYFRENIFPIISPNQDIQKEWEQWPSEIHNSSQQISQQINSIYWVRPALIDTNNLSGMFMDFMKGELRLLGPIMLLSKTSLSSCTCSTFKVYKQPCEHMYRLFRDLSFPQKAIPEIIDISPDILSKFYSLDEKSQDRFISLLRSSSESGIDQFLYEDMDKIIEIGLLLKSEVQNYINFLSKMTKDEIILALAKKGIQGFRPSWSKVKLMDWVIVNQPKFLSTRFKDYAHISFPPEVLSWKKGISISYNSWRTDRPTSLSAFREEKISI